MISFKNIQTYTTGFPTTQYSFLGTPEEARNIPPEHKDQIFFLSEEATQFLSAYLDSSRMLTGPLWNPFNERYFKTIDEFELTIDREAELKKWLYNKPIPFDHFVFMHSNWGDQVVMLTWKMVIKYWDGLFSGHDLVLFDQTLNWGLFYFHEDFLYFGSDKIYDKTFEEDKIRELQQLQQKYFNKNDLNFTGPEKRQAIKAFKEKYNINRIE
ncbi:MAG: hypothetical protein JNM21_01610 [Taibaiella sp.]|nr:hypothetical protein [Taibaiella sp.]